MRDRRTGLNMQYHKLSPCPPLLLERASYQNVHHCLVDEEGHCHSDCSLGVGRQDPWHQCTTRGIQVCCLALWRGHTHLEESGCGSLVQCKYTLGCHHGNKAVQHPGVLRHTSELSPSDFKPLDLRSSGEMPNNTHPVTTSKHDIQPCCCCCCLPATSS